MLGVMNDADRTAGIAALEAALARHPRVRFATLFGSLAQGRADGESDVDIGVAAATPLTADERMALIADLATATARPIDLVDLSTAGAVVLRKAICAGSRQLVRDPPTFARLMLRLWYDEADYMPLYRHILDRRRETFIHGS
jgi:predicted nucleotidyltransferase